MKDSYSMLFINNAMEKLELGPCKYGCIGICPQGIIHVLMLGSHNRLHEGIVRCLCCASFVAKYEKTLSKQRIKNRWYSIAIETLSILSLAVPADPSDKATRTETRIWEKEVDEYIKGKTHLQENVKTIFSIVLSQCTEILHARLEALEIFDTMSAEARVLILSRMPRIVEF
mmetsp:Transcript_19297/g.24900  ORF Transcript_19297/g.24900 Transcript_19297/m.24900 type:complete len:172 (+) Transcript_19297:434-949(+)